MESFRGFIAVEIPTTDIIGSIEQSLMGTGANIKCVSPENIHITLKFLGQTPLHRINDIESIMRKSLKGIKPHSIKLSGMGVFPNEQYVKIIWIGIKQSDYLCTIATRLNDLLNSIGFKREKRTFSAHLTLARMRSSRGKDQVLGILHQYKDTTFATVPVQEITLKKSTLSPKGPIYETITSIPLSS